MPSDRIQRRIDTLLDQAEAAADNRDWEAVAQSVSRTDVVGPVTVLGAEDGRYAVLAGQDPRASGRERAGANPCRVTPNE